MKKERGEAFTTSCIIQNLQSYELCGILDIEKDNRLSGSCQSNRLRLLGHYRMACMSQSASSYGLASWMHPQQGGLPSLVKKNPLRTRQSLGAVFLLLRTNSKLAKLWIVWYIKYRKDNRPQGGLPCKKVFRKPLLCLECVGVVFLCLGYLQY